MLIRKKEIFARPPFWHEVKAALNYLFIFFAYHSHWLILSCDKLNKSTSTLQIIILCLLPAEDNITDSHNWTGHFFHAHKSSFSFIISRHLPWLRSFFFFSFFFNCGYQINFHTLWLILNNLKLTTGDQDSNQRIKNLAFPIVIPLHGHHWMLWIETSNLYGLDSNRGGVWAHTWRAKFPMRNFAILNQSEP